MRHRCHNNVTVTTLSRAGVVKYIAPRKILSHPSFAGRGEQLIMFSSMLVYVELHRPALYGVWRFMDFFDLGVMTLFVVHRGRNVSLSSPARLAVGNLLRSVLPSLLFYFPLSRSSLTFTSSSSLSHSQRAYEDRSVTPYMTTSRDMPQVCLWMVLAERIDPADECWTTDPVRSQLTSPPVELGVLT